MDALYYDSALILGYMKLLLLFTGSLKNLLIGKMLLIFFLISFQQFVEDLTFFQSTMSDCCQHRIPVAETIFTHNGFQKL